MTKQEMFDRAWRGLKVQGFARAVRMTTVEERTLPNGRLEPEAEICCYLDSNGNRCAWGHVDPEGTATNPAMTVTDLRVHRIGIAASLTDDGVEFARELQRAHDAPYSAIGVERDMRQVAEKHGLTIPDEVAP